MTNMETPPIRRVVFISMHTSPLLTPGQGNAGGMNVYVDELARNMSAQGVEVDVFVRRQRINIPDLVSPTPNYRVHQIPVGPPEHQEPGDLTVWVPDFTEELIGRVGELDPLPDIIHSHYWLSGWVGIGLKRSLGLPFAHSFHTLGRIKESHRGPDDPPEPLLRIATELEVIREADCVIASTDLEAADLMEHYGANPLQLCVSPPGINHQIFSPGSQAEARERLGLPSVGPRLLYVGRIQPLKGTALAVETLVRLRRDFPSLSLDIIGGPSGLGGGAEMEKINRIIEREGFHEQVNLVGLVPHFRLVDWYRAADVLLVPSRSESFGLVAVEAQACGLPVVVARVGGLSEVVEHNQTGYLVDGWEPKQLAAAVQPILTDRGLAQRLGQNGASRSERFSWSATIHRFLELYSTAATRVAS